MFELTRALTAAAGIPAYEISNHARPGEQSRHNLSYWRYDDYVGVGPGAHGRRGKTATLRRKKPENWLTRIAATGHGLESEDDLSPATRATEALLMGLRLDEGIDLDHISKRTGIAADKLVDPQAVARYADLGFIEQQDSRVRVLGPGMLLLDALLAQIVAVD